MYSPRWPCSRSFWSLLIISAGLSGVVTANGFSSPLFLPGDATLAPAAGKQFSPEIAAGGNGYLAVWVDDRTAITSVGSFTGGPNFDHHIGSMWDIYAARLDAAGNLLDETPIIVSQQIQNQGMPDVAWNGHDWLVVWSGAAGMQCCANIHIFAARISSAGVLLDTDPILVDRDLTTNGLYWPCVSSDGSNWAVVWRDLDEAAGIFTLDGARISANGTVLDPGGVRVRRDAFNSYPIDPDLVFAGDEYLLVWTENMGKVMGQRLALDLAKIGTPFAVNKYLPSEGYNPRAATNGTDFFITWWEARYDYWSQLAGARVSHYGLVLDPNGIFLTEASGTTNYEPAVDWDGSNYVVVYDIDKISTLDLYATRVTSKGAVLDYGSRAIAISAASGEQREGAVASRAGGSLILWSDLRHAAEFVGCGDIFAATLAAGGTVGKQASVSLGAPRQTHLRLVPNGSGFLAVFRSETSPETRIVVQRTDASGAALDPEPVLVAKGTSLLKNPAGAWSGSEYLIVWEDSGLNQVFGRRLGSDLTWLNASPIPLLRGNTPDVAALDHVFLVVTSYEQPHEIRLIYSQRVRGSDGAILDSTPPFIGHDFSLFPRVTAFGGRWLAVWERHPTHDNPSSEIRASFVAPSGIPTPEFVASSEGERPSVAAGPDQTLIAWEASGAVGPGLDIYASRWLPDGSPLGSSPIAVSQAANSQFDVGAAWAGSKFALAFGDFRKDDELESHRGDISGAQIDRQGIVLDPDGFVVSADSIPEMLPHVAANGSDFIVGASVFRPLPGYNAYRIALRSAAIPVAVLPDVRRSERPMLASFPNPAMKRAAVVLKSVREECISVTVYDLAGRVVRQLFQGPVPAGELRLEWDLRDAHMMAVPPGVYLVSADTKRGTTTTRIVITR